jgi:CRP/FNR family cyclic AMP-dependent transcriptional regulator
MEVRIFENLVKDELNNLFNSCEFLEYADGETIISQDEVSSFLYGILDGAVDIFIKNKEGERILLGKVKQGDIVGEASIFLDMKRTADVVAQGKVEVVKISREKLINFVNSSPKAGVKIFGYIIFSLLHKLKGANEEILFEKEATISAKDLERLKNFFAPSIEDYLQ